MFHIALRAGSLVLSHGRGLSSRRLPGRSRGRRFRASRCDLRDLDSHRHRLPLGHAELRDRPLRRRGDLRVDLVGHHLRQRLVLLDRLPFLFEPPHQRAFHHALAQFGHGHAQAGGGRGHRPQYAASERIEAAIFSAFSSTASSSCAANGHAGMSGPHRRVIGPSRCSNASCPTIAASSAPIPPVVLSSCTISTLLVRRTDSSTASLSSGRSVRRSTTSVSIPSPATVSAAASAWCTASPYVTSVRCLPGRTTCALPSGTTCS